MSCKIRVGTNNDIPFACFFCPAGARSAPAGPIGPKGPEGTFRPFGPAGVLRRRLLHRNGTFVPPAPPTRTRRRVKTDFRRKTGRSGPFFHQSGRFQGVERAKFRCRRSRLFGFSRRWPESGRFGRFSGPRGPKWRFHFLQPSIPFFTWVAPKGPFWPIFGPRGVQGRSENANLAATRKPQLKMGPTQLDY